VDRCYHAPEEKAAHNLHKARRKRALQIQLEILKAKKFREGKEAGLLGRN
jgi:hypothetical protein